MEFIVPQKKLLESLNHFQSVVERRNTIPILSNIRILSEQDQGNLILTATDLALELNETLKVDVRSSGGITIPCNYFLILSERLLQTLGFK